MSVQQVLASIAPASGPNLPAMYWRFKASTHASIGNGNTISQWDDISGNNRHATQATSGSRPIMRTAASGLVGNTAAFEMNGSKFYNLPDMSGITGGAALYIVIIADADPGSGLAGSCPYFLGVDAGGGEDTNYPLFATGSIRELFGRGGGSRVTLANPTPSLTSWHHYNVVSCHPGGAVQYKSYLDNSLLANGPTDLNSSFPSAPRLGSGKTNGFNGKIAEAMLQLGNPSSTDRNLVHSYFQSEYGVT